ncbi:vWA domain-containing protein [Gallibacter sp. Marseille-QA0791]|uniref:vWA domain-containing protein n=1 Tax=Gallibacter sp. Marseille-QA0791 TaxID=3378781 RepID=UPI003D0CAC9C
MIYDITILKRKVLAMYPFFGSVAANVEYQEIEDTGIMKNDGSTIFYDPRYMSTLSDNDQLFLLAHELCHIAFEHKERGVGKDPTVWMSATDAVINQMLKRDGLEIISGGIDYPEAIDYSAEEYYELLLSEKLDIELIDGQLEGQETPSDSHSESKQEDTGDNSDEDESEESYKELPLEEDRDDEDEDDEYTLIEEKESDAGNAVNRDIRTVEEIGASAPLIDWRVILPNTINYGVDWSYSNAILEDNIVRPVLEELPIPETEIILDTSWSVDEDLLRNFLRECKNILTFSKMKAGCFDTVFYGFHDIRNEKDIDDMVFEGGGGTDFNAAVNAFTLRVDNRIIFTDGQAPMPDKPMNAIWVVYGDEEIAPDGGTVIRISPEQLNDRAERIKKGDIS